MPFPTISRYEDRNFTGICYFDVVPVEDIDTMPPEVGGNVAASIVLVEGAAWARVYLENAGGSLTEQWRLRDGDQYSTAEAGGAIAMDRLALMPYLWSLKGGRYVVVARTQNGAQLVMGTPTEPVMALVSERRTGDADRMESERNGYQIMFSLTRRRPVPFYGGTVPAPSTSCPSLCELMDEAIVLPTTDPELPITVTLDDVEYELAYQGEDNGKPWYQFTEPPSTNISVYWDGDEWLVDFNGTNIFTSSEDVATPGLVETWGGGTGTLTVADGGTAGDASELTDCLSPEQVEVLLAALGGTGGTVLIRNAADSATIASVTAPDSYSIPPIRIPYIDDAGDPQHFLVYVDGIDAGELTVTEPGGGPPPVPRFRVFASDGTTPVADKDITAPTHTLQQSRIKYKDATNASQVTAASDTEFASGTLRPATEIPRREILLTGGSGTGKYATVDKLIADTLPTIPQRINATWAAGDGDTLGVVMPAEMQGVSFSFVSETGSNGTITISVDNGGSFAAAPFTPGAQKVIFRRTTTTTEQSALYTTA